MNTEAQLKAMGTGKLFDYAKSLGVSSKGISRNDLVAAIVKAQGSGGSAVAPKAAKATKTPSSPTPPIEEVEEIEEEEEEAPPPPPKKAAKKTIPAPPPVPEEEDDVFGEEPIEEDEEPEEVEEEETPAPPPAKKVAAKKSAPSPVVSDDDDLPMENPKAVETSEEAINAMKMPDLKALIRDIHRNAAIKERANDVRIDTNGDVATLRKRTISYLASYHEPIADSDTSKAPLAPAASTDWIQVGTKVNVDLEDEGTLPGVITGINVKKKTADIELEDGGDADGAPWDSLSQRVAKATRRK